jgi:phage baseplate assembly protein W
MNDTGTVLGRGLAFPPRVGPDGRLEWSEGETNIREAIEIVLKTDRNERLRIPEFGGGLPGFLFEPNTEATRQLLADRIRKALGAWEPRIAVQSVDVVEDPADAEAAIATILYKLVATQSRERVSLSVAVGG